MGQTVAKVELDPRDVVCGVARDHGKFALAVLVVHFSEWWVDRVWLLPIVGRVGLCCRQQRIGFHPHSPQVRNDNHCRLRSSCIVLLL